MCIATPQALILSCDRAPQYKRPIKPQSHICIMRSPLGERLWGRPARSQSSSHRSAAMTMTRKELMLSSMNFTT
jgi:hypothetical protein